MKSDKDIRAVLKKLKDTAFKDHGLNLPIEATRGYLETMAQDRVCALFNSTFNQFSIHDLIRAGEILETEIALEPPKARVDTKGLN